MPRELQGTRPLELPFPRRTKTVTKVARVTSAEGITKLLRTEETRASPTSPGTDAPRPSPRSQTPRASQSFSVTEKPRASPTAQGTDVPRPSPRSRRSQASRISPSFSESEMPRVSPRSVGTQPNEDNTLDCGAKQMFF